MKHVLSLTAILCSLAIVISGCQKKPELTEQNPVAQAQSFENRKPFKFTISTETYKIQYLAPNGVLEDAPIPVMIKINTINENYPVKYDLDCDRDGVYEYNVFRVR